jgi:hypothetical protein
MLKPRGQCLRHLSAGIRQAIRSYGWVRAGEAVDDVPGRLDAELSHPLQQPGVLQRGDALAQSPQDGGAQALQAGPDLPHAGVAHPAEVVLRKVGLRLE